MAESAPEGEGETSQSTSGKIISPAEDKAAPATSGPRDVVKLSRSDASATKVGAAENPASKQEKLNAAKDDEIARAKATREAEQKVSALEKQVQDMQKLVEVKNQALNELQPKKSATPTEKSPAAAPATPKPEPQTTTASPAKPEEAKPTEVKPAEAPQAEAPKKPKKLRRPPPVAQPVPEPDLLDDPLIMGGVGGGLLALLGAGWLFLRNKRRRSLDSFEQGILTTSGLKPNTVFGNSAGGMVDTGDTSFLTDLSHGSVGMIDTNDVDPIAEAEVYMAYGRDVQAEEILKDAIEKDPKRYELHQKLLEIYSNRKDTAAFETLAGELYASMGAADPLWQKFAAMGHALEPANPLYQADGLPTVASQQESATSNEFSATVFDTPAPGTLVTDFPPEPAQADMAASTIDTEPVTILEDNNLDFVAVDDQNITGDIGVPGSDTETDMLPALEIPATMMESVSTEETPDLDFALDLPEPAMSDNVTLDAADLGIEQEPELGGQDSSALETLPELITIDSESEIKPEGGVEDIAFDLPEVLDLDGPEASNDLALKDSEWQETTLEVSKLPESIPENANVAGPDVALEEISDVVFEMPEVISLDLNDTPEQVVETTLELPSLEFENEEIAGQDSASETESIETDTKVEEVAVDAVQVDEQPLDFNFDVDMSDASTDELAPDQQLAPVLPDLNLSGISLDMDDSGKEDPSREFLEEGVTEGAEEVEQIVLSESESTDVDTKLDLVSAYMDMGDTEGARELLEEVMREGGPQQRERAQELLNSLG